MSIHLKIVTLALTLWLLFALPGGIAATERVTPGDKVEVSYSYEYRGLIVKGVSKFVFSVTVIELNSNRTQALVKVTNIRRYWNDEIRETDIESMPFTDPRGYKTYGAPPDWGSHVALGDTAWIGVSGLYRP